MGQALWQFLQFHDFHLIKGKIKALAALWYNKATGHCLYSNKRQTTLQASIEIFINMLLHLAVKKGTQIQATLPFTQFDMLSM